MDCDMDARSYTVFLKLNVTVSRFFESKTLIET